MVKAVAVQEMGSGQTSQGDGAGSRAGRRNSLSSGSRRATQEDSVSRRRSLTLLPTLSPVLALDSEQLHKQQAKIEALSSEKAALTSRLRVSQSRVADLEASSSSASLAAAAAESAAAEGAKAARRGGRRESG